MTAQIPALYTGFVKPISRNFETRKWNGMFPFTDFLLATIAIVIVIICYIIIVSKLKPANESSEISEILQETFEDMPEQRRMEMLERIKEERIKGYLDRKRRKAEEDS